MPSITQQKGRFTVTTKERTPTPTKTKQKGRFTVITTKERTPTPKKTQSKTQNPIQKNTKKASNEEDLQELVCKMKQVLDLIKNIQC